MGLHLWFNLPLNLDTLALFWLNAGGLPSERLVRSLQELDAQGLPAVSVF